MMHHPASSYRRALKRNIRCTGKQKRKLLNSFDATCRAFLSENPNPTQAQLAQAFGTPEEMADVLMAEVSEADRKRYRRVRALRIVSICVCAAFFIALTVYIYFLKERPIKVVSRVYVFEYEEIDPHFLIPLEPIDNSTKTD